MFPHQSHQVDQINGGSTPTASSSTAASTELMDIIVEKMANNAIDDIECATGEAMDVSSVDATFNVPNYLPANILMEICDRTNDTGLMYLAEISERFASIAKIFVINGERLGGDPVVYAEKWHRFGSASQAVYMNRIQNIDSNHWTMKMLQPHMHHITKLSFDSCTFKAKKIFSEPLVNLKHLTFGYRYCDHGDEDHDMVSVVDLPKCGNLHKLELHYGKRQYFSWNSLEQIICGNPTLQSLLLHNLNIPDIGLSKIIAFIGEHLNGIKELALMMEDTWSPGAESVINEHVFKSYEHLESLTLSVYPTAIGLLHLFGAKCMQIKHLGLHIYGAYSEAEWNNVLTFVARSFQQIECFYYYSYGSIKGDIEPIVEQLPKLCDLRIEPSYQNDIECSDALPLLRKCSTLQKITFVFQQYCDGYPQTFISAKFFDDFIATINMTGKLNACIEIEECNRIIGSITVNGAIWRKKLMHWMDCDVNNTNINLLDLGNCPVKGTGIMHEPADQPNLLDRICEYLDVGSLHSLAETNAQCKDMVKRYVKNHSKKDGMFVVTDEISPFETVDIWYIFDELELTQYATKLKVCTMRRGGKDDIVDAIQSLVNVVKLSFFDGCIQEYWSSALSGISYVDYDSLHSVKYSDLQHIIQTFPDAETIVCKCAGVFSDFNQSDANEPQIVGDLKQFVFNYRGEQQMEQLKNIFKNTNTQLIPMLPKKD